MLLIIDNYDSFTYNLYQSVAKKYPYIKVIRNDEMTLEDIEKLNPKGIILSPGPGRPEEAGICVELILHFGSVTPILGVCLGHQAIGLAFGAEVKQTHEIFHGKDSLIFHNKQNLFKDMELPFKGGRYHSLAIENPPKHLIIDAETADGVIMGMHHSQYPIYGVQFHPESILTPEGDKIVHSFLEICL